MFKIGYNTNGFNCHPLPSALEVIGQLGYQCVAISIDHYALNPWAPGLEREIETVQMLLERYSLSCTIETGARFLLDPWRKHEPTLVSQEVEGRKLRLDFLKRALDIASKLGASAVSFWSGKRPKAVNTKTAWDWLISGCLELTTYAEQKGIPLSIEPEPGMFIERLSQYHELSERIGSRDTFGLTLDLGHAFLSEELTVQECVQKYQRELKNIHIEDMKIGVHEHLVFGEGDMNFSEILEALKNVDYEGPINVELSRHSHNAVMVAKNARESLLRYMRESDEHG